MTDVNDRKFYGSNRRGCPPEDSEFRFIPAIDSSYTHHWKKSAPKKKTLQRSVSEEEISETPKIADEKIHVEEIDRSDCSEKDIFYTCPSDGDAKCIANKYDLLYQMTQQELNLTQALIKQEKSRLRMREWGEKAAQDLKEQEAERLKLLCLEEEPHSPPVEEDKEEEKLAIEEVEEETEEKLQNTEQKEDLTENTEKQKEMEKQKETTEIRSEREKGGHEGGDMGDYVGTTMEEYAARKISYEEKRALKLQQYLLCESMKPTSILECLEEIVQLDNLQVKGQLDVMDSQEILQLETSKQPENQIEQVEQVSDNEYDEEIQQQEGFIQLEDDDQSSTQDHSQPEEYEEQERLFVEREQLPGRTYRQQVEYEEKENSYEHRGKLFIKQFCSPLSQCAEIEVSQADKSSAKARLPVNSDDTDYAVEMLERPYYTKLCQKRPNLEDLTASSSENGGFPQFIQTESQMHLGDFSRLMNNSPMRYTELTEDYHESKYTEVPHHISVHIKHRQPPDQPISKNKKAVDDKKRDKKLKKKITKSKSIAAPNVKHEIDQGFKDATQRRILVHTLPDNTNKRVATRGHKQINRSSTMHMKNVFFSKSVERLKARKNALFSRMIANEERIIEVLDKLRLNLLEVHEPYSQREKARRKKNAFEFSVRFSRNFLYPLRAMINELSITPVHQLNSAASNNACNRVSLIFSLILQSLQAFQKQIRFFLLDQVPQKLTTLIDLIHKAIRICLQKGTFDRNDIIVDCLLERCGKFREFLEEMEHRRQLKQYANYEKMNKHTKYDLKMYMNDLNMYEAKLVPQYKPKRQKRIHRKLIKEPHVVNLVDSDNMMLAKPAEDDISTQIQALQNSSGVFNSLPIGTIQSTKEALLGKAIIQAFQSDNRQQVGDLLIPLINSLNFDVTPPTSQNSSLYQIRTPEVVEPERKHTTKKRVRKIKKRVVRIWRG